MPPEHWNRLGTKLIPKLRTGSDVKLQVTLSTAVEARTATALSDDLRQILTALSLDNAMRVEEGEG